MGWAAGISAATRAARSPSAPVCRHGAERRSRVFFWPTAHARPARTPTRITPNADGLSSCAPGRGRPIASAARARPSALPPVRYQTSRSGLILNAARRGSLSVGGRWARGGSSTGPASPRALLRFKEPWPTFTPWGAQAPHCCTPVRPSRWLGHTQTRNERRLGVRTIARSMRAVRGQWPAWRWLS